LERFREPWDASEAATAEAVSFVVRRAGGDWGDEAADHAAVHLTHLASDLPAEVAVHIDGLLGAILPLCAPDRDASAVATDDTVDPVVAGMERESLRIRRDARRRRLAQTVGRCAAGRLPRSAPPIARAWLASLEAVSLGYLGDRAALKALDDAQRCADATVSSDPVWPWVFQFDAAKIASYRAIAASRLGLAKMAAEAFSIANGSAGSPKQAAIVAIEHARATASDGHLDQACALALAAYDVGSQYNSERVRQAVHDFRTSLGTRAPQRVTAELDDRLHGAYTDRAN
jgi:hypothetical protein